MNKISAALCTLAVLLCSSVSAQDSLYTLTFATAREDVGLKSKIENAGNADYAAGPGPSIGFSISRLTLGPCAVRAMHLHRGVDEAYYVLKGTLGVGLALPNGTIVKESLPTASKVFVTPANHIHSLFNEDCRREVVFLAMLNKFDGAVTNVALGALNMPAGPFLAYSDPRDNALLKSAATNVLTFDPVCVSKCRLTVVSQNGAFSLRG